MSETLIQKAKSRPRRRKTYLSYTDEEYHLALAHMRGEITFLDIQCAMDYNNINSVYTFLYNAFKRYYTETNKSNIDSL